MSDSILLDGREVQVTISDLVLHLEDDEFRGNIDFVIAFSEAVPAKDVLKSLRLAITSRHTRELLDVVGYEETSNGLQCTMGWGMLCEVDLSESDIPEAVAMMWEDHTIGTFALGRKGTMESSDSGTADWQQAVTSEDGATIPDQLRVDDSAEGLTIFVSWYTPAVFFQFFSSILWTFFAFYFTATADWLPLQLFGALFSVTGFGLIYYAICLFKNHTRIQILNSELTTSDGPLPWPKLLQGSTVKIPVSEISSVSTNRYQTRRNDQNVRSTLYKVTVSTRAGEDVTLVSSFRTPEPAVFIVQKLKESLGIS